MLRDEVIQKLTKNLSTLREHYNVSELSIFGSVARNQATTSSDIDLLIDFSKTPGLFTYIELKHQLEDLLGAPVDLVTRKALKPQMRETIISEAIRVN